MNDPFDQDDPGPPPVPSEPGPIAQPPNYPPPHTTGLRCHHCQGDLSGVMLGGSCPQCGAPITAHYYPSQQSAGMAMSSMVLGIVSAVTALPSFCCFCITGVSGICGILAIIFYFPAVSAVQQETAPASSKNMALSGLICGIIGIVLTLGSFAFMMIRF